MLSRLDDVPLFLMGWVGSEKHTCLGKLFASQQVMIGSIMLLNEFEFSLPDNSPHIEAIRTIQTAGIMAPTDLELKVNKIPSGHFE
jgi:cytochrome P450